MDVKLTKKPTPTVTVSGEIDHYNYRRVEAAVREACQNCPAMILDLSEVSYLDSAGVQLVFMAGRLTRESEGRTAVVVKNVNVERILEVAGVGSLPNVKMVADLDSAQKYLT